jgi:hypothetical protein
MWFRGVSQPQAQVGAYFVAFSGGPPVASTAPRLQGGGAFVVKGKPPGAFDVKGKPPAGPLAMVLCSN